MRERLYVESVEYPEMVFGPDGFWLVCGECDWDGPMRDRIRKAGRDKWRHPRWLCRFKRAWLTWKLDRRYPAHASVGAGADTRKETTP